MVCRFRQAELPKAPKAEICRIELDRTHEGELVIRSLLMPWRPPRDPLLCGRSKRGLLYRQWRLRLGSPHSPPFHLSAGFTAGVRVLC
jgi:hypothetical protein